MTKYALIAVAAAALAATPAAADTVVVTGDTTGDPTFNRPLTTTVLSAVGTAVAYETTQFTVSQAGNYTLSLTSGTFDTFLALYGGSFNPASGLTNVLAVDDDSGDGSNSLINFNLAAGTSYFAVATGFDNLDFGAYSLTLSGPGTITVGDATAVPEPASWAMMIGGFGLVGGAMRRRRMTTTVRYA